jgi:hypothetical protein
MNGSLALSFSRSPLRSTHANRLSAVCKRRRAVRNGTARPVWQIAVKATPGCALVLGR